MLILRRYLEHFLMDKCIYVKYAVNMLFSSSRPAGDKIRDESTVMFQDVCMYYGIQCRKIMQCMLAVYGPRK